MLEDRFDIGVLLAQTHIGPGELEDETLREEYAPAVRNADNEYLGSSEVGPMVIGYVDEVNGPGAAAVPDLVPTRHEVIQLLKYWYEIIVSHDYFWFCYQQTGGCEERLDAFANRRVERIASLLGETETRKTIDEFYEEYGKKQDLEAWDIFLNGDEEQREAFQEEQERALSEQTPTDSA